MGWRTKADQASAGGPWSWKTRPWEGGMLPAARVTPRWKTRQWQASTGVPPGVADRRHDAPEV